MSQSKLIGLVILGSGLVAILIVYIVSSSDLSGWIEAHTNTHKNQEENLKNTETTRGNKVDNTESPIQKTINNSHTQNLKKAAQTNTSSKITHVVQKNQTDTVKHIADFLNEQPIIPRIETQKIYKHVDTYSSQLIDSVYGYQAINSKMSFVLKHAQTLETANINQANPLLPAQITHPQNASIYNIQTIIELSKLFKQLVAQRKQREQHAEKALAELKKLAVQAQENSKKLSTLRDAALKLETFEPTDANAEFIDISTHLSFALHKAYEIQSEAWEQFGHSQNKLHKKLVDLFAIEQSLLEIAAFAERVLLETSYAMQMQEKPELNQELLNTLQAFATLFEKFFNQQQAAHAFKQSLQQHLQRISEEAQSTMAKEGFPQPTSRPFEQFFPPVRG